MSKQQTAVEFLYEFVLLKLTNEQQMQFEGLFTQAKQMENEQIVESHKEGQHYANNFEVPHHIEAEQYYESKYGKDENTQI